MRGLLDNVLRLNRNAVIIALLTVLKWCFSSSQELLCVLELELGFGSNSHTEIYY